MDYPGKVITKNQVTPTQISATGVWTLDDAAAATRNNNWPVAGVPNPISKSLRFNSADSAYLSRTPASAGNRTTMTFSWWMKYTSLNVVERIFSAVNIGSNDFTIYMASDNLNIYDAAGATTNINLTTTQVFRDISAWYHFVVSIDTTQATASNRIKLYVNGVQVTSFITSTYPAQNTQLYWNTTSAHNIGRYQAVSQYLDGYLTEINFIDGQALTPTSFGMTDPITGVWEPLKYSGTYGANGFYLNFKDATSTTTLGLDYSGNSNTWTTNNFSVTAGAGNDSLTDVPTPWIVYNTTGDVGGVVRGNYCTMNPLAKPAASSTSNGNLTLVTTTAADERIFATIAVSSGKWYWEATPTAITLGGVMVAITSSAFAYKTANLASGDDGFGYYTTGNKYNPSAATAYGNTFTTNDVIGVALDLDNGKIWFSKNGTWQASGDPAAGTNAAFTSISGTYSPSISNGGAGSACTVDMNFGQRPFAYTPPSGFRSLCTTNLPASTIVQGNQYFDATLYTGTGATQSITNSGSMQPDFVWIKCRSNARDNLLFDAVRGVYLKLYSNLTVAEASDTGSLTAFNSNGFTIGGDSAINASTNTFVGWQWNAGGSTVTNTSGTISAQVRANTTSGFSIVTYTGTGTNGATVGHGLGVVPDMIIVKRRNSTGQWATYHRSIGNTGALRLNATSATITDVSFWNNTSPTSTVFTIGVDGDVNTNTGTYVAYCFDSISGFSAFGSYTGNGSSDGPFVYTGFRPRYVMVKRSDSTGDWIILDTSRDTYNLCTKLLYPNLSNAEETYNVTDILSNGFKQRNVFGALNASGGTYIYMAFAENPFKNALAR